MAEVVEEVKAMLKGALKPPTGISRLTPMPPRTTEKEHAMDRLQGLEDKLFDQAIGVVTDVMGFSEIPFSAVSPPDEWLLVMDEEEAWRKFRNVKAGQMKSADAPSGVKVAQNIATGIMKTRALRGAAPVLNIQLVQLTVGPEHVYPTQSSDSRGK